MVWQNTLKICQGRKKNCKKKRHVWSCGSNWTMGQCHQVSSFWRFIFFFFFYGWRRGEGGSWRTNGGALLRFPLPPPFSGLCLWEAQAKLTQIPLQDSSLVIRISETNRLDGWSCAFLVLPPAFTLDHMSLIELMGFWHRTKGKEGAGEGGDGWAQDAPASQGNGSFSVLWNDVRSISLLFSPPWQG